MATYQAYSYAIYDELGDKIVQYDQDSALTELTTINSTFDPNELVTGSPGFTSNLTFLGTTPSTGGGTLLVFRDPTYPTWYTVFSPSEFSSAGFPSSFNVAGISTGAYAMCFAAGTLIASPNGERRVEDLRLGDEVVSVSGRAIPVKWIGRQSVSTRFGPAERLMPVRFAAGSLGDGLPHTDLTVTADHGILVGGAICHAGALVNDTTIKQVPLAEMGETYTVYHIETAEHEIILANGAPAETFIDNVSRRAFDNYAEFEALYGDVPEMEELLYPRAMSARQVPERIRAKLAGARLEQQIARS
ncbi:Hint domain-containing protein [Nioella aestuarii]|uniref:Hint domain-containing protein n=1 Tax=Nioella aestuarii TaxID=1662864 RepID=UPI003D7FD789